MKTILMIFFSAVCGLTMQDTPKMSGSYVVQYDKKYELETYRITFKDSIYTKVTRDAFSTKGKIDYDKFRVLLRKDKNENPIEIDNREINKDTIKFITRNKTDLSLKINQGRLIRIKK